MLIPDDIRKCVVFVGIQMANGTYRLVGSAFFLGKDDGNTGKATLVYLVTAAHVIKGVMALGLTAVWIRANLKDGEATWIKTAASDWVMHPSDSTIDVAIMGTAVLPDQDHLVFPFSRCATAEALETYRVGVGDEVVIAGLFTPHHGTKRNIPIVRVGNIACMPEDVVQTKLGDMKAYLIEARSIGGISGSPVFVNLGALREVGTEMSLSPVGPLLLGLIHGHFDAKASPMDLVGAGQQDDASSDEASINMGIAIVVPWNSVLEVIKCVDAKWSSVGLSWPPPIVTLHIEPFDGSVSTD